MSSASTGVAVAIADASTISETPTGASMADVNDRGGTRRGSDEVTAVDALVEAPHDAGIYGGGKHESDSCATSAERRRELLARQA